MALDIFEIYSKKFIVSKFKCELNYKKVGNGAKTVIVMHEWMGDHTNYDTAIPYLNITDFTWIFVDFRAYGLSKEIKGEYTLIAYYLLQQE